MKANRLGLPLEYKKHPEYFDAHNISNDADAKNAVIEKLLKKQKVCTVLDMTCGTGSQVFYLAARGYQVTGADFSPALLGIARKRARQEKVAVKFLDGDMRVLKAGQFDAVITIANAIGHLTKAGFEKAIKNIYRNLKEGGIYIFDIFNLEAMDDRTVADFAMHSSAIIKDVQLHQVQYSTIDRKSGRLTSYDYYVTQQGAAAPKSFKSKFALQLYTAKQLQEVLGRNGFEILEQCAIDGSEFVKEKSVSILTVARRK